MDEYVDDGYTARDLKRPELRRMLNDVKQYDVDFILFTKIDSWSRGVRNYYKLQDILDENGVAWKTIFEEYDTTIMCWSMPLNTTTKNPAVLRGFVCYSGRVLYSV